MLLKGLQLEEASDERLSSNCVKQRLLIDSTGFDVSEYRVYIISDKFCIGGSVFIAARNISFARNLQSCMFVCAFALENPS